MIEPGRKFVQGVKKYRYGFNGQEKSDEIKGEGNSYTAEFWEYDPRIGRRWNVDPVSKEWESPYATFSNNPIVNIDPNGDTDSTYKTPGGGSITTETSTAQTFDGSVIPVGKGKNQRNAQPAKGTLRSFVATDEGFEGGSARYVATFDANGKFSGYGWDKDLTSTYDDYLKAKGINELRNLEHVNDPTWDPNLTAAQAKKNFINNSLGLALPTVLIRPLTIATNIEKFTVDPNKFNYFFGKVVTGPQTNIARSAQNLKDLTQLGITTEDKLMKVFSQAMQSGATVSTKVTQYGTNVMKSVNVGGKGSIEVGFFYKAGNMSAKPAVTTIIPKIFK
jgi:RHS repeat-associated protein